MCEISPKKLKGGNSMKKDMYEKPTLQVVRFAPEDVVRTSNNFVTGTGDAIFDGYTTEDWN